MRLSEWLRLDSKLLHLHMGPWGLLQLLAVFTLTM
jgi:hypothetical protein